MKIYVSLLFWPGSSPISSQKLMGSSGVLAVKITYGFGESDF